MTNLSKWHDFYTNASGPIRFGNERSYRVAAEFLKDCATVQDWGCGTCWLRQYIHGEYLGIDGSGPHVDEWADLVEYTSEAEGICLRHVLEHNDDWRLILANALASMRKRLVIVLSVPLADEDIELSFNEYNSAPHISLCQSELMEMVFKAPAKTVARGSIVELGSETCVFVSVDVEHDKAVEAALAKAVEEEHV